MKEKELSCTFHNRFGDLETTIKFHKHATIVKTDSGSGIGIDSDLPSKIIIETHSYQFHEFICERIIDYYKDKDESLNT